MVARGMGVFLLIQYNDENNCSCGGHGEFGG